MKEELQQISRLDDLSGHTRPNGSRYYTIYPEYSLSKYRAGEEVGMTTATPQSMSPESFAQIRYNNMMFNDAGSNWGHRDDLLSKTHPYSEIAVSVGFVKVNGRTWACLVANLYW